MVQQTICEHETQWEQVQELVAQMEGYVCQAVGREELHEVEDGLFRRLQQLGRVRTLSPGTDCGAQVSFVEAQRLLVHGSPEESAESVARRTCGPVRYQVHEFTALVHILHGMSAGGLLSSQHNGARFCSACSVSPTTCRVSVAAASESRQS